MNWVPVRLGLWCMEFDRDWAGLRRITYAGHEVLRGISAPIRDEHWGTVRPRVENLVIETAEDNVSASFQVLCQRDEIDFRWQGEILLSRRTGLSFKFSGRAFSTFRRNRIGLCLLHPSECAGTPCVVRHSNGHIEKGCFPKDIAPHQPFLDIRTISYEAVPGLMVDVSLEGETFEMEDQRNWTDASFKTYCTPLALPTPVEIQASTTINQSVQITVSGHSEIVRPPWQGEVTLSPASSGRSLLPSSITIGGSLTPNLYQNYAEFNRSGQLDEGPLRMAFNPQVHAFDEPSIIECLAIQALCVENAKHRTRSNQKIEITLSLQPLDKPSDSRWTTPFAAAWALASLKYLSEAGADKVHFSDIPPVGSAVEKALIDWRNFAGSSIRAVRSSDPGRAVGILLYDEAHGARIITVSLKPEPQTVRWEGRQSIALEPWEWKVESIA